MKPAAIFRDCSPHTTAARSADDELLLDIDPSGETFQNVRGIVHGVQVKRPVDFGPGEYHDIAMTYYDGELRIYFDGVQLGDAASVPGGSVELMGNLLFGEDYAPTSLINEPFEGRVDDILVLRRPLEASRMAALSQSGAEAFFADSLGSRFSPQEGDTEAVDRRTNDGLQNGTFLHEVSVDTEASHARVGDASFLLATDPGGTGIEIADSSYLGEYFTLAAFARPASAVDQLLFGAANLIGGTGGDGLALELITQDGSFTGVEFTLDGEVLLAILDQPVPAGEYHHVAVTFAQGDAVLYFDGEAIGTAAFDLDCVELDQSLFFGLLGPDRWTRRTWATRTILSSRFDAFLPDSVFDLANPEFVAADINGDGLVWAPPIWTPFARIGERPSLPAIRPPATSPATASSIAPTWTSSVQCGEPGAPGHRPCRNGDGCASVGAGSWTSRSQEAIVSGELIFRNSDL